VETIVRHVRDLNQQDRSALERVVGHSLGESQQIVIQVASDPQKTQTNGESVGAGKLPDWCRVYDGLTDNEIDELDQSIVRLLGGRDVK
jgi:hypothetical protein